MYTNWLPKLPESAAPKYRSLFHALEEAVISGELPAEAKLPPIRELAYQLKMTPATVVRAYQLGIDQGLLDARVGDGTYVRKPRIQPSLNKATQNSESGINLRSGAIPDIGQTALINMIIKDLANTNIFEPHHYPTPPRRQELQSHFANWLNNEGIKCEASEIIITKGATNASIISARTIAGTNRKIKAMVEPVCYVGFRDVELFGIADLITADVDKYGITPESIRRIYHDNYPELLLTSSVIQNPYSITMTEERMAEIAALARELDFHIIDDVIHSHCTTQKQKTLRDYAPERVWTVTSLSKLGYPGLQCGVMIPPKSMLAKAEAQISALNIRPSELQIPILSQLFLSSEFTQLQKQLSAEISARQEIIRAAFKGYDIEMAEAAPFAWLNLPSEINATELVARLSARNISIASADTFAPIATHVHGVRITIGGAHSREDFAEALKTVTQEIAQLRISERVI